ncbi:MAG: transcriptional repressor [Erysipelotrichaceae bacterium]|nr:transcriptional repressor [Erysipelotrichaceae bacterium]
MGKYATMILEMIDSSDEHLTAEQIYLRLKEQNEKIVLATVYNNLNNLVQQEKIRRLLVEGGPDHYDRIVRHDHLICPQCGRITDIHLEDFSGMLSKQVHRQVLSYELRISCLCETCQKRLTNA